MVHNLELFAALVLVLLVTALYALVSVAFPVGPSSLFGHGIGVLGFALMIATEVLYSWRKTRQRAYWGRTQIWLSAHIVTGIVGPYMVLLHTGFRFAGVAGLTLWLTLIVVGSGFVGRYVYTAIPRTSLGDEIEADQIEGAIRQAEAELQDWLSAHSARLRVLAQETGALPVVSGSGLIALLSQGRLERRYRRHWDRAVAALDGPARAQALELAALLDRRRALQRQARRADAARRVLAVWHTAHVPLALAVFAAAVVHAIAVLYYS